MDDTISTLAQAAIKAHHKYQEGLKESWRASATVYFTNALGSELMKNAQFDTSTKEVTIDGLVFCLSKGQTRVYINGWYDFNTLADLGALLTTSRKGREKVEVNHDRGSN